MPSRRELLATLSRLLATVAAAIVVQNLGAGQAAADPPSCCSQGGLLFCGAVRPGPFCCDPDCPTRSGVCVYNCQDRCCADGVTVCAEVCTTTLAPCCVGSECPTQ